MEENNSNLNELVSRLPAEARQTYQRLKSKYPLEFQDVVVGGRPFHFLTLGDLEPLIGGKDIFADALNFPFWVKIWEASVMLALMMANLRPKEGERVLELGAGLGVSGMVAAGFGHRVTITDYKEEILDFGRVSAGACGVSDNVEFALVDWTAPADLGRFETIIASEVLFHERFFKPLLKVFRYYLAPGGTIYLSHDIRRKSLAGFLPLCEEEYQIAAQKKELSSGDEEYAILLTRLTPKGG